ncbi:MAG TPA: tryptophan synthase subunit alpha [Candidatus Bathyarchaeia archaeon]|nr:tryptophan synthase subunit alpha [Candidatus Bathyarchaeia archaeon]
MPIRFTKRPSLIAYITCGDPDLDTSREVALAAIHAGADTIELGVPFSDPVADGPVIQRASERALKQGTDLAGVLEIAKQIRSESEAGLIVFSYLNPILQFGLGKFCSAAAEARIDGALVTDLPVEEAGDYLRAMKAHKLAPVFLAAPTSPDDRLRAIARHSRGFVYAISRTGITGARQELADDARALVARLRAHTKLPIALGFGISTPAQFAEAGSFADAAVIGSAIVQRIEQNPGREAAAVAEFLSSLTSTMQQAGVSG